MLPQTPLEWCGAWDDAAFEAGGGLALETVSFQHEKESWNETPIC